MTFPLCYDRHPTHNVKLLYFTIFFQEFQKRFEIFRENMKKVQFLRETERGTGKYGASPFADMVNKCVTSYLGDLLTYFFVQINVSQLENIGFLNSREGNVFRIRGVQIKLITALKI